jgi:menaquinol-cytochrome c reductase iron-sulfur subunit
MKSDEGGAPRDPQRRKLLVRLGGGVVGAAMVGPIVLSARSLVPNALYESPQRFKVGPAARFTDGVTYLSENRVFVFRRADRFHCLSAVCTHLGCTVQMIKVPRGEVQDLEFHCPCHGSKYKADGTNFAGPAPKPLASLRLEIAPDDRQLIVDSTQAVEPGWRLTL